MRAQAGATFEDWVAECRRLVALGAAPGTIVWEDETTTGSADLFAEVEVPRAVDEAVPAFLVPRPFKELARAVFHHRSDERLHLLYDALWRILYGERNLLELVTDQTMYRLMRMRKEVSRDAHKMHAFVRFRKVVLENEEWYVAWHRPDHRIVRYTASFFMERFAPMNWTILTPDESVSWNQRELKFLQGVPKDPIGNDSVEELWLTYYASVFNPARLKLKAMTTEMPVRLWRTLPETAIIPDLVAASTDRTAAMLEVEGHTARDFIPTRPTVESLREAANGCRGCPLFHGTTQAVCSEGPATASIVLIGEQPGNEEDLQGRPFVGPAGDVLNRALAEAGVERELLYITEAVKHFKHENRNGRRYHRNPSAQDVAACRPWLVEEMRIVQPKVVVCLGGSAAQSVLGRQVRLKDLQGQVLATPFCDRTLVTTHPAAILRNPDREAADMAYAALVADLRRACSLVDAV